MSNTTLTASIIAKAGVRILENEIVFAKNIYRGYEDEFDKKVNGYTVGDTISIRRPADFTVREGAVADVQDVVEGKTTITCDQIFGVDFKFSSPELTLKIDELADRVMRPAMIQLANKVDTYAYGMYKDVPNWVGTPGEKINSFADFAKAPERLDEYSVPNDVRKATLSPADNWGLIGSQTSLYVQDIARGSYRKGALGEIAGVDTFMSQNVLTHTCGSDMSGTVGASVTASTISYNDVKDSMQQTITTSSLALNPGDVFTIADVNAVNPVTKADLGFAKQFTVVSHSSNSLTFYPAIIWDGAHKNVAMQNGTTDLNTKAITAMGTANTGYKQNLVFHKNAFALVTPPLVKPPGAMDVARESYNGFSVRVIPYYDGTNDVSNWRMDILCGKKTVDPRLATRVSGTGA
jgi:hypothetical protein